MEEEEEKEKKKKEVEEEEEKEKEKKKVEEQEVGIETMSLSNKGQPDGFRKHRYIISFTAKDLV